MQITLKNVNVIVNSHVYLLTNNKEYYCYCEFSCILVK